MKCKNSFIILGFIFVISCSTADDFFKENPPKIISTSPSLGERGVDENRNIEILFNKDINAQKCISAFTLLPDPG